MSIALPHLVMLELHPAQLPDPELLMQDVSVKFCLGRSMMNLLGCFGEVTELWRMTRPNQAQPATRVPDADKIITDHGVTHSLDAYPGDQQQQQQQQQGIS